MYFFDEASESLINKTIHAVAILKKVEPEVIKDNVIKMVKEIKSPRAMWNTES